MKRFPKDFAIRFIADMSDLSEHIEETFNTPDFSELYVKQKRALLKQNAPKHSSIKIKLLICVGIMIVVAAILVACSPVLKKYITTVFKEFTSYFISVPESRNMDELNITIDYIPSQYNLRKEEWLETRVKYIYSGGDADLIITIDSSRNRQDNIDNESASTVAYEVGARRAVIYRYDGEAESVAVMTTDLATVVITGSLENSEFVKILESITITENEILEE